MSQPIHQASDKLVKQALANVRVAKDFFEAHLPETLLAQTDLNTLKLQKNSFIDDDYVSSEADVVYAATLAQAPAYFYILCEHQSQPDPQIAFRLLKYTVRLMEYHLKQHPKNPLPVVYPLVIYSGAAEYHAPRDIYALFGEQSDLAKSVVFQPYQLIDLARLPDETIKSRILAGVFEFALKYQRLRNQAAYFKEFIQLLARLSVPEDADYAHAVVTYVVNYLEADEDQLFVQYAQEQLPSPLREEIMTIAQRIEQRGRQQATAHLAKKLLEQGMKLTEVAKLTELSDEDLKKLLEAYKNK